MSEFHKNFPNYKKYDITQLQVTTEDGYILAMFRVRLKEAERAKLPANLQKNTTRPILMQHGLTCDAAYFVENAGSIGHHLLDKGFDIFFGSNRGTRYSLGHTNANLQETDYYDYSFTEMGLYDDPAFVKKILEFYPDKKIIYFGHSQGTSQMFVSLSDAKTKDFMRKHIAHFVALAPICYMNQISSSGMSLAGSLETYLKIPRSLGMKKFGANTYCKPKGWFECPNPLNGVMFLVKMAGKHDGNSSLKQLLHFAQLSGGKCSGSTEACQAFRPYDEGSSSANQKRYGAATPPEWTFSDWTTPTTLITGDKDEFSGPANRVFLDKQFPSNLDFASMVLKGWDHQAPGNPKLYSNQAGSTGADFEAFVDKRIGSD